MVYSPKTAFGALATPFIHGLHEFGGTIRYRLFKIVIRSLISPTFH
jgi:hypothetical protein